MDFVFGTVIQIVLQEPAERTRLQT